MKKKPGSSIYFEESFIFDMKEILSYLAENGYPHARKVKERIFNGIALLEKHPQLGKCIDELQMPDKRCLILDEFIVLYSLLDGEIHIERLLSDRQDYHRYI